MEATGVKEQVLAALEHSRGTYVSGGELATRLGVSRNAVWKAVDALKGEGCPIEAVTNRGYRLDAHADVLSPQAVLDALGDVAGAYRVTVCKTVDSTNTAVKALAARGEPEGLVLMVEEQTAGRGRMRRSFHSPAGTGVYMSVLLRPALPAAQSVLLTLAAAVAAAEAIEAVCGCAAQIKWVNDILLDGRKVCGILTEAAMDLESGALEYAVVGFGINVCEPPSGFPPELQGIAGALFDGTAPGGARARLAAEVLKRFHAYAQNLESRAFLAGYRERSMLLGKEITVLGAREERATALAIDDDGRLLVRLTGGTTRALSSGEVSVKRESEGLYEEK